MNADNMTGCTIIPGATTGLNSCQRQINTLVGQCAQMLRRKQNNTNTTDVFMRVFKSKFKIFKM